MAGIHIIKKAAPSTATKFDWQASEGGPNHYPMEITGGYFISPNGDSLYIPSGATLHNGWGNGRSSHIVGEDLKSLPDRLSIRFFSYSENQFYSGDFALPYKKILALFQAGHYSPKENDHITFHRIIVGVAPGGAVSVWLVSLDNTIELFFGYAKKMEGNWQSITENTDIPREEYVRLNIEETFEAEQLSPETIASLNKKGIPFGLWEKYHQRRYHWQTEFTNLAVLDNRIDYIRYFNGERGFIDLPDQPAEADATRAVPSQIDFIWNRSYAKPLRLKLLFNEDEIFTAFEKLGSSGKPLQLEMRIEIIKEHHHFSIWLKNDTESIVIKQTKIKTYGIPE